MDNNIYVMKGYCMYTISQFFKLMRDQIKILKNLSHGSHL